VRRPPALDAVGSIALVAASGLVLVIALAARRVPLMLLRPSEPILAGTAQRALASPETKPSSEPSAEVTLPGHGDDDGCHIEDTTEGDYRAREVASDGAHLYLPDPALPSVDLLLHFHGGEPVRRLIAPLGLGLAIATVDLGQRSQPYAAGAKKAFDAIKAALDQQLGGHPRAIVLSAWSAGFGAVRELLALHPDLARAVVLLDSVHTSYRDDGSLDQGALSPFFDLADRAQRGEQLLVFTHSAITPNGYASTSEVAQALLAHVGGRQRFAGLEPHFGVLFKTRFDRADLHLRGYTGTDQAAHCAQLKLLPAILKDDVLPFLAR
jgi:pimeloyl-ACP methyl ester carboxylesterase